MRVLNKLSQSGGNASYVFGHDFAAEILYTDNNGHDTSELIPWFFYENKCRKELT